MDSIGHWLLQVMSHNLKPIVWIICTHTDRQHGNMTVKKNHIHHWMDYLRQSFEDSLSDAAKNLKQCCQGEDLSKKLEHIEDLRAANVPAFLQNHMQIIELTNTYGFEGSKKIYESLDSLVTDSESALPNLTAPLCKTWQEAMDRLQKYAEDDQCSNNLPSISLTRLEHITQLTASEDFVEYQHNIGYQYKLFDKPVKGSIPA